MSTDSSQNPKPLSALVVVEGDTEKAFFNAFGTALGLNLTIHAVCCNVYNLYHWMVAADLMLEIPALIAEHTKDPCEQKVLRQHYDAVYLIYDCDVQDTSYLRSDAAGKYPDQEHLPSIKERACVNMGKLQEMVERLDDEYETTVGKLYLNYPMVESLWDADSFNDPLFQNRMVKLDTLLKAGGYKEYVGSRLLSWAAKNVENWAREDFLGLVRMNYLKASRIVRAENYHIDQMAILEVQKRRAKEHAEFYVLNTAALIPLDQFGDTYPDYCSSIVSEQSEPAVVIKGVAKTSKMLCAQLQGIMRVKRNVDVVIFPETFCRSLPDYHNRLVVFDMQADWTIKAVRTRLAEGTRWCFCCRAELVKDGGDSLDCVLSRVRNKIVLIRA